MVSPGFQADARTLHKVLQQRYVQYQFAHSKVMHSTHARCAFILHCPSPACAATNLLFLSHPAYAH